ncbi:MAG: hypothetical protein GON13_03040 [Nanoarchaeota archaeon]|nr:hypothetical protein [Nanoarchaeota archaeon]
MREFKVTNFYVSEKEIVFFLVTISVLSFLFVFNDDFVTWGDVLINYVNVFVLAGLSFLFFQLVQKAVAQIYGARTRYVLWTKGFIFSFIVGIASLGKLVFFSMGFTEIVKYRGSRLGKKSLSLGEDERGKIILSGVLASLGIAFLIKLLSPFLSNNVWVTGVSINVLIAIFNLIPVPPLSGSYVFVWNRVVWAITSIVGVTCFFLMPVTSIFWVLLVMSVLSVITFLFMMGFQLV